MKNIIGIGSALVDILAEVPNDELLKKLDFESGSMNLIFDEKLPTVEKEILKLKTAQASGGSAGNTCVALGRLGSNSAFLGKVNEKDDYGIYFINDLKANSTTPVMRYSQLATGRAHTFIEPNGERTFGTYLGAASELTPADVTANDLQNYDVLYVEGYLVFNEALIKHAIKTAKASGLKVAIDMASYNIVEQFKGLFQELLQDVDIVFANEDEARAFTGLEASEAVSELAKICSIAVVKTGKDGSIVQSGDAKFTVGAEPVNVVDTTGAGDFYAAGFLYALGMQNDLTTCAKIGTWVAQEVIQVVGASLTSEKWQSLKDKIAALKL